MLKTICQILYFCLSVIVVVVVKYKIKNSYLCTSPSGVADIFGKTQSNRRFHILISCLIGKMITLNSFTEIIHISFNQISDTHNNKVKYLSTYAE